MKSISNGAEEINFLRQENERLKKRIAALEAERGPGIKAPQPIQVVCDNGWDD